MFLGVVQVRNISNYSYIKTSLHACVPSFSVVGLVIFVTPSVQSACPLSQLADGAGRLVIFTVPSAP